MSEVDGQCPYCRGNLTADHQCSQRDEAVSEHTKELFLILTKIYEVVGGPTVLSPVVHHNGTAMAYDDVASTLNSQAAAIERLTEENAILRGDSHALQRLETEKARRQFEAADRDLAAKTDALGKGE